MNTEWMRRGARGMGALAVALAVIASPVVGSAEPAPAWPIEIIDRPLTLPGGWMSAGVSVAARTDLSTVGSAATGLWGVSYGVTDALSLGVGYSLAIRELEGRGPLDVNAGYTYLVAGPLTLAATGGYSHDFMTGGDGLAAGTLVWLMVDDAIALISPGGQLAYALDDGAVSLSLPVAVGVQLSPRWFAQLGVELAKIGVAGSETTAFAVDQAGLDLAVFASPHPSIDVGASIAADPEAGVADTATFGLVVMVNRGL